MLKATKLTRGDLLDQIYKLRQEVAKLKIEITILKDVNRDLRPHIWPITPRDAPVIALPKWAYYPYVPDTGGIGDSLPESPYYVCK